MRALKRLAVVMVAMVVGFGAPLSVSALTEEQLYYYSQNGILFYDPSGRRTCYSGNLSGDTIMAKVVNYLKGNNPDGFVLSDNGVAGVLANFQAESGFNPFRFQGDRLSGPAYGIAQFDPMSKITNPLRTDPRTANYFNDYFRLDYTRYDASTGYPVESVPNDVIDAWLSVQLDFFFGPSSEFETTRVGQYRNLGGTMGLDYIDSAMTVHEAMEAARTPEDAVRIFVWIMERPGNKAGEASARGANAQTWLAYVENIGSSYTGAGSTVSSNGNNVTIVGDSIVAVSENEIRAMLPNAYIDAQAGRQFYTGESSDLSGIDVLRRLESGGNLRDIVVYALGTNGGITLEQAQEVLGVVGASRKVVFVTNYTASDDYDANNNVFARMKNQYSGRVLIADWKSAVQSLSERYLGVDGMQPNDSGRQLLARLISSVVNASASTVSVCVAGSVDGGLTDAQAQALASYYNSNEVSASEWNLPYGKHNCVSFSAFFVQKFTSVGRSQRAWGNGRDVANNLALAEGLTSGTAARPFAVFSVTRGVTSCGSSLCGHTGIVVRVDGDSITTIEAQYSDNGGTGANVRTRDISWFVNSRYGDTFTYLDDIVDVAELLQVVGGY